MAVQIRLLPRNGRVKQARPAPVMVVGGRAVYDGQSHPSAGANPGGAQRLVVLDLF